MVNTDDVREILLRMVMYLLASWQMIIEWPTAQGSRVRLYSGGQILDAVIVEQEK